MPSRPSLADPSAASSRFPTAVVRDSDGAHARIARSWLFTALAVAALVLAAVARLRLDLNAPLWLDESWTGAFASEPTVAGLTEQVRNDPNAPAYYYLIWLWTRIFGLSNAALHLPSMAVSLLAPGVAWAGLRRRRPFVALIWAVLLATWSPGFGQADEARCYALLFGAAIAATLAHVALIEAPSLRRGAVWAGCAAFMTMVHYYAGMLALAQGIAFVALHRGRALRLWPASLPFLPAFAWIGWHAPRIADFAKPGVAWYDVLPVTDLPFAVLALAGGLPTLAGFTAALLIGTLSRSQPGSNAGSEQARGDAALLWSGGAALAAVALCLGIAVLRPTFTSRYLTPFVPGVMLLAAAAVARRGRAPDLAAGALAVGPLAAMALTLAAGPSPDQRIYNFEVASGWLAKARPPRLAFFWDHPSTPVMARGQLDAIGGFFLRRAGLAVEVVPVRPTAEDMNGPVLAAAGSDGAAIWMYDVLVHHTSARVHRPRLSSVDPGLECRDFGGFNIGVVACRRRS